MIPHSVCSVYLWGAVGEGQSCGRQIPTRYRCQAMRALCSRFPCVYLVGSQWVGYCEAPILFFSHLSLHREWTVLSASPALVDVQYVMSAFALHTLRSRDVRPLQMMGWVNTRWTSVAYTRRGKEKLQHGASPEDPHIYTKTFEIKCSSSYSPILAARPDENTIQTRPSRLTVLPRLNRTIHLTA
jgi:hypothetical protein